jgi:small subunit ribosomal protein S6
MHKYEVMVIFDPTIDERTVAPTLDKFLTVITTSGGTVDKVDIWGRRRMTYQIQKHSEAIYAVINLTSTSDAVVELDRQLKLNESVLRTKVLRQDEAVFSINPIEFVPEEKQRAPRGPRKGGAPRRPSAAKAD